ncbi:MAG: GNAT family N-acetyltransferase [Paenibacillaceae bacterium]|nr:GNAT family N-acetyltransferase [Paenibacillaceae bacterium]
MKQEPQVRLLRADEMACAVSLADSVFRADSRVSMGRSLPKVFSASLRQAIGCFADGALVSFAGLVPAVVRIGGARIAVYSYGAVCTHPAHRGKGHARAILQFAKRHAEQAEASLLLVSGELPLYTEAGCRPFGTTGLYRLLPEHAAFTGGEYVCREAGSADWFRLQELAEAKPVRYESSLWDLADLLDAGAVASIRRLRQHTFLAEKDGGVIAFCVVAMKPREEAGEGFAGSLLIEWAGDAAAAASLLQHIVRQERVSQVEAVLPWQERELALLLAPAFVSVGRNQGTVYVVDAERLFRQLAGYWIGCGRASGGLPAVRAVAGGAHELTLPGLSPFVMGGGALAAALFDGAPEGGWGSEERERAASAYFPVPFPYTKGLHFV